MDVNNYFSIGYIRASAVGDQDSNYSGKFSWGYDRSLETAEASFIGARDGEKSGHNVSPLGDINLDGYDDFAIGASSFWEMIKNRVYLVFGGTTMSLNVDTPLSTYPSLTDEEIFHFGFHVSYAGDIDDDGDDDVLLGAPYTSIYSGGSAYLYSGKSSGWIATTSTEFDYDYSFSVDPGGDGAGHVAGVGDINGDGNNDFVVGAPYHQVYFEEEESMENSGCVYIVMGPQTGYPPERSLTLHIDGWEIGQDFGTSVSGVGDINNDGYDDFMVSNGIYAPNGLADCCHLVLGRGSGTWEVSATFVGEEEGDLSIPAGIGNFNGDDYDDFAISAPKNMEASFPFSSGKVYVFFGAATGWEDDIDVLDADFSLWGSALEEDLGAMEQETGWAPGIDTAGDMDGDGYDDMVVLGTTTVYLICGKATTFCENIPILEAADGWCNILSVNWFPVS